MRVCTFGLPLSPGRKLFIMRSHTVEHLEVHVTDPVRLYDLLNGAEAVLRQTPQRVAGILVTRHDPFRYTLALSDTVPFGETRERILS